MFIIILFVELTDTIFFFLALSLHDTRMNILQPKNLQPKYSFDSLICIVGAV